MFTPGGFFSLGDNGAISFDLTAGASTTGLFLYIGEVGDNGEVAAGSIRVDDRRTVAEPSVAALLGLALFSAGWARRRR